MSVIKRKHYGYSNSTYCDTSNLRFFYLMTKKLPWGMDKLAMFYLTDKHGELDDFMKRCTVIASTSTRKTLVGLSCT